MGLGSSAPLCCRRTSLSTGIPGEVRRERRELVHGTDDRGEIVHNDSRECNNLLAGIARKLNLAAHNGRVVRI